MAILHARDSVLLVVDMQARLLPAIDGGSALARRCGALIGVAKRLAVPVIATEHCGARLGATLPEIACQADRIVPKTHFDATREVSFLPALPADRTRLLVVGTEAHVCVLQTTLGLKAAGLAPVLVADCIGSRRPSDRAAAVQRAARHDVEVVTFEMVVFEWLESGEAPQFRDALALVKSLG
ncbi:MAG: isochorismatase family protein [Candidimonas sp.]|nr:MAG: isochorismatase family protein [Candidimonas sp.]